MANRTDQNQGCLTSFLKLFGIQLQKESPSVSEELPYRIRDDFLSPAEASFYHVIASVVGERAIICPKVNLADIFFVVRPNENLAYRSRIAQKHLDFLLCNPKSMQPIVGIELDDSSHTRKNRQARDEFVDQVFCAAGLPLMRIAVQHSYNINELATQLAQYLDDITPSREDVLRAQSTQTITDSNAPAETTLCPKCGVPMVIRTAKRGQHKGSQFYACPNYPQCRIVLPFP